MPAKFEFVNPDVVAAVGSDILELLDEKSLTEAELYVACREVARFLESKGVTLIEGSPQNDLN